MSIQPMTMSTKGYQWRSHIEDDPYNTSDKYFLVIGLKSKIPYFVTDKGTVNAVEMVTSLGRTILSLEKHRLGMYDNLMDAKYLLSLMSAELKLQAHMEYHGWGSISVYDSLRDCNLEENCRFFRAYERGQDESRTQD